ncbi:hypothetical protein [Massilia sp. S19_KUP03_FR1]|uniref:hypothetical protein n=1 Tax=Massilia sp. S19_KUP03_FR1 TaxID=3025503 RepID=UPI002FCCB9FB
MLSALLAATLATLPADPLALPSTLSARLRDPGVIRAAVRQAVAGDPAPPLGGKVTVLSAAPYRGLADAMDDARVPACVGPDGLKHQPTNIGPLAVGGVLTLPFLALAALRGRCN